MKVVLDSEADREFVAELRNSFPSVNFCQAPTKADQVREIPDAEVLFGAITPAVFEAARKLRWCHFVGAGFDPLVRGNPAFVASDVVLTNAPGTHAMAMADHVMGMILTLAHRLVDMLDDQRAHRWDVDKYRGQMRELEGHHHGTIGRGIHRAGCGRAGTGLWHPGLWRRPEAHEAAGGSGQGLDSRGPGAFASDLRLVRGDGAAHRWHRRPAEPGQDWPTQAGQPSDRHLPGRHCG